MKEGRWTTLCFGPCPRRLATRIITEAGFTHEETRILFGERDEARLRRHGSAREIFGPQLKRFVSAEETLWEASGEIWLGMFGLEEYTEVFEMLEAFGIAYAATSDASHDALALSRSWHPGLDAPIERAEGDGEVLLTRREYDDLVRDAIAAGEARDEGPMGFLTALNEFLTAHFTRPVDPWDHVTQVSALQVGDWWTCAEAFVEGDITLEVVAEMSAERHWRARTSSVGD